MEYRGEGRKTNVLIPTKAGTSYANVIMKYRREEVEGVICVKRFAFGV
jgi:hypothetical protein